MNELIRTKHGAIPLTSERKAELADRLNCSGHPAAAAMLQLRNAIPAGRKLAVLGVLNDWLAEAQDAALAEELCQLRYELDADIGRRRRQVNQEAYETEPRRFG